MNIIILSGIIAAAAAAPAFYYRRYGDKKSRTFSAEIKALEETPPEVILDSACEPLDSSGLAAHAAGIIDTYRRQNTAWCEGDGAAYAATFTDDADFVAFDGTHTVGRDQIEESHQELFDTFLKGTCIRGYVKCVRFLSDSAAVVHVVSGTEFDRSGRIRRPSIQTYVAVKRKGEWRFSSFHNSRIDPIEARSLLRKMWLGIQTVLLRR